MDNKVTKVIGSIVAIIAAALLIVWQVKSHGPKTYTVSDAEKQAVDAEEAAVRTVFEPAVTLAEKSGWEATTKYWASGRLNANAKKTLKSVFGSSFKASDMKDLKICRDAETGYQCALFEYNGKHYAFYFIKKNGKYQISEFGAW